MTKKSLSIYKCSECNYQSSQWKGKCPECKMWNTFLEMSDDGCPLDNDLDEMLILPISKVPKLSFNILKTGLEEFDRVLGGGIVQGSLTLLAGQPGVGKSTLITAILGNIALGLKKNVLYVSGEETLEQVGARVKRLNFVSDHFYVFHETKWQSIKKSIQSLKPELVVLDSIQTTYSSDIIGYAGSLAQIKEVTLSLMEFSKKLNISLIIIGHITKDGNIAGPKLLEHMVDTVLYFENEKNSSLRILRSKKNRFGQTTEIGLFKMEKEGLKTIKDLSMAFVNDLENGQYGSCLGVIDDSGRSILCEVQALITENNLGQVKRVSQGVDVKRVSMLLAILEKYLNIQLGNYDLFLNITGPLKKIEKELDLAIIVSIVSSYRKMILKKDMVLIGELGLTGEVRVSSDINAKIDGLIKLGFKKFIVGKKKMGNPSQKQALEIGNIHEIKKILFC